MSHSYGEIWSPEGSLQGHFEYNGTADVACTRVHLTEEGVEANWRGDHWRDCQCGAAGESVVIYTSYGGGFYWNGKVCWGCMAITDGIKPEYGNDGHPFPVVRVGT